MPFEEDIKLLEENITKTYKFNFEAKYIPSK